MLNKTLLFLGLLLCVTVIGVATFIPKVFFPATQIECLTATERCSEIVVSTLQPLLGKSLLFTDYQAEVSQLPLPSLELTSVHKKLPGTLLLQFQPKQNEYIVQLPSGEQWVVADNGYAQLKNSEESLPLITVSGYWTQPISNQQLDPNLHSIIHPLLTALKKYEIPAHDITLFSPTEITFKLDTNHQVIANNENIEGQIHKLSVVRKELDFATIDTGITTIDLRFKFPILKT